MNLRLAKFLTSLVLFFIFAASVSAQTYVDYLYLKNGSVLKGVILEQDPSGSVKIQTGDGSIFVYPMSDVLKITKEEVKTSAATGYITPNPYADPVPAGLLSWSYKDMKLVVKADQQYEISMDKLYDLIGESNYSMFTQGVDSYVRGDLKQTFAWWTAGGCLGAMLGTILYGVADEDEVVMVIGGVSMLALGGATLYLVLAGDKQMKKGEALMNGALDNYNNELKSRLSYQPTLKINPALMYSGHGSGIAPGVSLTINF